MVIIQLKVIPRTSGEPRIVLDKGGFIKCYVKSPPEDGRANKEVIALLAKKLSLPTACIEIASGLTAPKKMIKIDRSLTLQEVYRILGFEVQQTLMV